MEPVVHFRSKVTRGQSSVPCIVYTRQDLRIKPPEATCVVVTRGAAGGPRAVRQNEAATEDPDSPHYLRHEKVLTVEDASLRTQAAAQAQADALYEQVCLAQMERRLTAPLALVPGVAGPRPLQAGDPVWVDGALASVVMWTPDPSDGAKGTYVLRAPID